MKQNKTYLFFIGVLVAILFTGCQNDDFISSRDGGNNGTEKTVTFSMNTLQWQQKVTTRSGGVTDMQLLCFDEYGLFIGRRQAAVALNADNESGTMTVEIPTLTQRVHFIANGDFSDFNDAGSLSKHENALIPTLSSGDGRMVYWGYKQIGSSEDWGETPITLYRNQVRISFEKEDADITDIAFTVSNYYTKGTVAPFNTGDLSNPFGNYSIASELITIPENPGFEQTGEGDMVSDGSKYIYETANAENNPVFGIFKVKYTGDNTDYYHKILLADSDNFNQLPLYRNHWYKINIKRMPKTSGYKSFDEAVAGDPSNNPFITIDDILPDISSGDYTLSIMGGTSHIFQEENGVIQFRTNAGLEANELKISWIDNNGVANITNQAHSNATGEGTIALQLNMTDGLQYAELRVQAGPLVRNIKIYVVKAFSFKPVSFSTDNYNLKFYIPDTYPADLYPIECKIISDRFDGRDQLGVTVEEFVYNGSLINEKCKKYIYIAEGPGEQTVRLKAIGNEEAATAKFDFYVEANYFQTAKIESLIPFQAYTPNGNHYRTGTTRIPSPSTVTISYDSPVYGKGTATYTYTRSGSTNSFTSVNLPADATNLVLTTAYNNGTITCNVGTISTLTGSGNKTFNN